MQKSFRFNFFPMPLKGAEDSVLFVTYLNVPTAPVIASQVLADLTTHCTWVNK